MLETIRLSTNGLDYYINVNSIESFMIKDRFLTLKKTDGELITIEVTNMEHTVENLEHTSSMTVYFIERDQENFGFLLQHGEKNGSRGV